MHIKFSLAQFFFFFVYGLFSLTFEVDCFGGLILGLYTVLFVVLSDFV